MKISASSGGFLDTLAQSGTSKPKSPPHFRPVTIKGTGTDLFDINNIHGRSKRKFITQKLALALVDVAMKMNDLEFAQKAWNTYHCQNEITEYDGRLYGNYCKNRFCTICLCNRKADIIHRYLPVIQKWSDPHLLTLTIKAPSRKHLKLAFEKLIQGFRRIVQSLKKEYSRLGLPSPKGIRSYECNFNPLKKTYNPHVHVIVENEEIAINLRERWLNLWKVQELKYVSPKAQHIRPVKDTQRDLVELIKYGSKIFTEPHLKKMNKRISPKIYITSLYHILKAMEGRRLFDRFGFNLPSKSSRSNIQIVSPEIIWQYDIKQANWIDPVTSKLLSDYLIPDELYEIMEKGLEESTS